MADAPPKLNFNQRKHTMELMGLVLLQSGNGRNRKFNICRRGAVTGARALEFLPYREDWVDSWVSGLPMVEATIGPTSIEAVMKLEMSRLQWLLS